MPTSNYTIERRTSLVQFIPVMLCFFAMGFVDLVGAASNYVKDDFQLSDTMANLLPSLVFFWFLIFSVPTGMLMNKIGRKKTVQLSLVVTAIALIIPSFGYDYTIMLIAFSFLGIGNAIMQTSLNPLVSNLISPDKLASTLTFGQFVKAIASFLAPIIISWGAVTALPMLDLGWRVIFAIYAVVCLLSIAMLGATPIKEEKPDRSSGIGKCFKLLGNPFILLCFIGIVCHVGIDVGTNATAPKILKERILDISQSDATLAITIYFIARTIGCFLGSFALRYISAKKFFGFSVFMMLVAMALLFVTDDATLLYTAFAMVGFGNSNIFSIIFAQSLIHSPNEKNEVSGLMIMGLIGGAIFPFAMGVAADAMHQQLAAVAILTVGVVYLLFYTFRIRRS